MSLPWISRERAVAVAVSAFLEKAKSGEPTMHHRSSSFWVSICLSVLLHCFYRPSQSTVSLIQWCRLSLISLGTTTMKFAFQTVLSLSSSFAFVKGQTDVYCYYWPCDTDTTHIQFIYDDGPNPIPSEIGLLTGLEQLYIGTFRGLFDRFWFLCHLTYHSRLVELCVTSTRQIAILSWPEASRRRSDC